MYLAYVSIVFYSFLPYLLRRMHIHSYIGFPRYFFTQPSINDVIDAYLPGKLPNPHYLIV